MPGKITSGGAANDLMANLQTHRTAVVSPFSCLNSIENKEGYFTAHNDVNTSSQQSGVNSSEFCNLMQSQPGAGIPHQSTFRHMTLAELMDNSLQTDLPPNSKEFKVILFNEALKNHQFGFDSKVIAEIKSSLLSANSPSYKYLASVTISISQAKVALAELKKEGKLNEAEFNTLNLRLAKYAESLSSLGNNYCRQLSKKPDQDFFTSFLVIRSHKNGGFTRLFKQAENIDKSVKEIVLSHDETKQKIARNLNNAVSQFIVHYFKPERKENVDIFQQLRGYIKPGAYDKIQALFKNESRNRPGHQFDAGGIEHLHDCYAEIFDHFKMYDQFVHDQNTANEPRANGSNPADQERPITPENFDDGVNDDFSPNEPVVNGEPADKERPAAQRPSGGGINNHFSPVFNPINSPNFINNVNSDLLDKLHDNNRLLAKILDQLTKKSSVSREVQTDDMPALADAEVNPMALDIAKKRFSSQFSDTYQPQKTDKSTAASTNVVDGSENAGGITSVIAFDQIDVPIAQKAVTQLSKSKIAKALSHVTVLPGRAQMMDSFQPNVDTGRHGVFQMKVASVQPNLLKSSHHGQRGSLQNEMEKVVLKPTMTKSPEVFTVNDHYKERSYYDESGQILPGFVSNRRSAFENRSDVAASNQKNKIDNAAVSVANALNNVIDIAINRSNVTMPVSGDTVTAFNRADVSLIPAKKILKAERVRSPDYFLDMLQKQRHLEKL